MWKANFLNIISWVILVAGTVQFFVLSFPILTSIPGADFSLNSFSALILLFAPVIIGAALWCLLQVVVDIHKTVLEQSRQISNLLHETRK